MTDAAVDPARLVSHYRTIGAERMQGLPIVNPRLDVEAVGFRVVGGHRFGVLIAPWFMNMVLLPGGDDWSAHAQGDKVTVTLPAGDYEFVVCRDDTLPGCHLSAVLFRSMTDFPDQDTARAVAREIMLRLFEPEPDASREPDDGLARRRYSRRALLSGGESR